MSVYQGYDALATHTLPEVDSGTSVSMETVEYAPTTKLHGAVRVPGTFEDVPWTAEFPEGELAFEGLLLLLPGFGGIKVSSRGERHANAVKGIPSVSYDPARLSWNLLANLTDSQGLHARTADAVLSAASETVRSNPAVPNRACIDPQRFILSAHSMGGFAATQVGLQRPCQIDGIVYKASPGFGLHGIDPVGILREFGGLHHSREIHPSLKNYARFLGYFLQNPTRTLGEGLACMVLDTREEVSRLRDRGIGLAYLGFEHDTLVPPRHVMDGVTEVISTTHVMPGVGHLAPQRHPQRVSDAVTELRVQASPAPS